MIAAGETLNGKYLIERRLGAGGMGIVMSATHVHLDVRVAIKIMRPEMTSNRELVERFLREAKSAAKLTSEHVCRVHDVGVTAGGSPYMVMEYMDGHDLRQLDHQHGLLDPGVVVDFILQACEALAEAHSVGIVHRDIKPANLFIARQTDGGYTLKVLDFGISKAATGGVGITSTHTALGTPAYMSPQQMHDSKEVDERADIWSLGVVIFELLTGRRPFASDSYARLCVQIATQPVPPMPASVAPGLAGVVMRCLERDENRRFQTVAELVAALAPFAHNQVEARRLLERATRFLGGRAITASIAPAPAVNRRADTASVLVSQGPQSTLSASAAQLSSAPSWPAGPANAYTSPHRRVPALAWTAGAVALATLVIVGILSAGDDANVTSAGQPAEHQSQAPKATLGATPDAGPSPDSGGTNDAIASADNRPEPAATNVDDEPAPQRRKKPRKKPSNRRKHKGSKKQPAPEKSVLDML